MTQLEKYKFNNEPIRILDFLAVLECNEWHLIN